MNDLQTIVDQVSEQLGSDAFGIWFLLGAVLVFFMQCGFAMVETGFTRAKNAGNIIMMHRHGGIHAARLRTHLR